MLVWDCEPGKLLCNAIIWCDICAQNLVHLLDKSSKGSDVLRERCGLPITIYFSAVKFLWMLENVPVVKDAHNKDTVIFGTVDTWLTWVRSHVVIAFRNAAPFASPISYHRTAKPDQRMFMDIKTLQWSDECCKFFGVKWSALPHIVSSSDLHGNVTTRGLLDDTPISGILGDQQAVLVGRTCFSKGDTKNTYWALVVSCFSIWGRLLSFRRLFCSPPLPTSLAVKSLRML